MSTNIDRDMFELMMEEFLIDQGNDFDDDPLLLDGSPEQDEAGNWYQSAHDNTHSYTLHADIDGNIYIVP